MWLLTLKSIVVATDLDEGSGPALRTAARLAHLAEANLHLLHVASSRTPDDEDRLREHYRRVVADAPDPLSVQVIVGSPAEVIVEEAIRVDADAVVLGPHRSGSARGAMGSTATSVVRATPCPCLVAATEIRLPLERVLIPIDLSEVAGGALSVALSWASALRPRGAEAQLTALHVAPHPAASANAVVHDAVGQARERAGGAAHVEIREMVAAGSDPAEEIVREGISMPADLLVMGTRGAADSSTGLGSVSAAVARTTPCPLLLVPPATWEEQGAG